MIAAALLGLALSGSAQAQAEKGPAPCPPEFVGKARGLVEKFLKKSRAPGVAVAIYDNGKSCVLVAGNQGGPRRRPVEPDTMFAMGSVQKVFTSTMLAHEIDKGKAKIDDPAAAYLVAAGGRKVASGAAFRKVTLKDLVTHTASLPMGQPHAPEPDGWSLYRDRPMPAAVMTYLNAWKPPYPPGTRYKYSNLGHVLAGHAAVKLAGIPYTKLLSEAVTGPLGMKRTGRAVCDGHNPKCAEGRSSNGRRVRAKPTGLWTTADDMLRFIEANLGVLEVPGPTARALALTHEELFRANPNHAVGMAWEEWHSGDALLISKNGANAGFAAWVAFQPHLGRGVCVLTNKEGKPAPGELGSELLKLAAEK
jgi:CubicO group peptidase (beta-lactamase class C family)